MSILQSAHTAGRLLCKLSQDVPRFTNILVRKFVYLSGSPSRGKAKLSPLQSQSGLQSCGSCTATGAVLPGD